jgi:hypothetical protein
MSHAAMQDSDPEMCITLPKGLKLYRRTIVRTDNTLADYYADKPERGERYRALAHGEVMDNLLFPMSFCLSPYAPYLYYVSEYGSIALQYELEKELTVRLIACENLVPSNENILKREKVFCIYIREPHRYLRQTFTRYIIPNMIEAIIENRTDVENAINNADLALLRRITDGRE